VTAVRSRPLVGLAAAAALLFAAPAAFAQKLEVPRFDGWVTDRAGLLTPGEKRSLEERMESYRRGSGNDIALLTVPSLNGEPIETFALRVGREWKLGAVGKNNGAILVVSKEDRWMRIEVGRGLEGTLPDVICGRIIHDFITPRFQEGEFGEGLREGIEALQRAAGGDYAALPPPRARHDASDYAAIPALLIALIVIFSLLRAVGRGGRGGRGGSGGSIWPWIFVADSMMGSSRGGSFGGGFGGGSGGGGFGGFGGGGGFSGGGASGRW
jgi:uncharacterized protein